MELYKLTEISGISVEVGKEGGVTVRYRPILESLYYSPGAKVVETDGEIRIGVIRCGIKDSCDVTHRSEKDENGSSVILVDHAAEKNIYLTDEVDTKHINP